MYYFESCKKIYLALSAWPTINGLFYAGAAYSFYLFSPLAYGMSGPSANDPNSTMHGLKWVETWEF